MDDNGTENAPEKADTKSVRIAQGRSPAYPHIDLEKAVGRADQIREAGAARHDLPPETFYRIWEIGAQSSTARQTMAALNHFGLVDYIGRGEARKVKLSNLALKIVYDKAPDSQERAAAIQEAAIFPPIHNELFQKYGHFLPDDLIIMTYLTRDRGYNERAAKSLIGEYKATLRYAELDKPYDMLDNVAGEADEGSAEFKIGDGVNWMSQGQTQWLSPWKIVEIADHDDGKQYLKVEGVGQDEGLSGWIPMSEAMRPETPESPPPGGRVFAPPPASNVGRGGPPPSEEPPKGARREVFALDEGDVVLICPDDLSKDSYDDLEGYLKLFLKKARRRAGVSSHEGPNPDGGNNGHEKTD